MKTLNIGFRICEGRTWNLVLLILLKHPKQTSLLLLYNTVYGMIMRILHGHSACTVNSLVLSQSLTWWITKNQHSNGNLCHSFEQNILEDIQQTQVNIKHRAYLQNHFLGEPTVDPPNLFTGDFFSWLANPRFCQFNLQDFGWWQQQFLDVFLLDLFPHLSLHSFPWFHQFLDDFHLPR